jgi:hypothetical protein
MGLEVHTCRSYAGLVPENISRHRITAHHLHCELIFTVMLRFTVHCGVFTYPPPLLVLASDLSPTCSVACFSILF